jgi:hypothetical protein
MLSSGGALDFALFCSSSHCNVSLTTLGTMCHLSLGCGQTLCLSILFVLFLVLFCFCLYICVFIFI